MQRPEVNAKPPACTGELENWTRTGSEARKDKWQNYRPWASGGQLCGQLLSPSEVQDPSTSHLPTQEDRTTGLTEDKGVDMQPVKAFPEESLG